MATASFLVTGDEVHRIEFDDGSWIDIARSVTVMQRARWTKAAATYKTKVHGSGKKATTETDMDFDNERFLAAFLTDVVKDTSAGPIDINQLSEIAASRIREEFDKLNPAIDGDVTDDVKNSDAGQLLTSAPSEGEENSPAS